MNTASLLPAPDSDCSTTDGVAENGQRRVRERRHGRSRIPLRTGRSQSRGRSLGFQCSLVTHFGERDRVQLDDLRGAIELPAAP